MGQRGRRGGGDRGPSGGGLSGPSVRWEEPSLAGFDFLSPVAHLLPSARWAWVKREGLSRRFVLLATRLSTMRKASLREGDASTRDASSAHLAARNSTQQLPEPMGRVSTARLATSRSTRTKVRRYTRTQRPSSRRMGRAVFVAEEPFTRQRKGRSKMRSTTSSASLARDVVGQWIRWLLPLDQTRTSTAKCV